MPKSVEQAKINLETAKLPWAELQRFFAAGKVLKVADQLDLTQIALDISQDDVKKVQTLIAGDQICLVPDAQAKEWIETDALVWCVVVNPYVLVQSIT